MQGRSQGRSLPALELFPYFFRTEQEDHVKIWMIEMQAPLQCVFGSRTRERQPAHIHAKLANLEIRRVGDLGVVRIEPDLRHEFQTS